MEIRSLFAAALLVPAVAGAVAPTVRTGSVMVTQAPHSSKVVIDYILDDGPAVVTLDICTNGVSIGDANIQFLTGDVNKLVASGARKIVWTPWKSWEGHVVNDGTLTAKVLAWAPFAPPPYMVVDLVVPNTVRFYTSTNALPDGGLSNDVYKKDRMVFRRIPAAGVTFRMGAPVGEPGRLDREVVHLVSLTNDYYMGIYELTQRQWLLISKSSPQAEGIAAVRPAYPFRAATTRGDISTYPWPTATYPAPVSDESIAGRLRAHSGLRTIDLPTEAQWEFACRAGHGEAFGNGTGDGTDMAWCNTTVPSGEEAQPVGIKTPNSWGLYDMHGNVWEWCLDRYATDATYSDGSAVTEPVGPASGSQRVVRGGNYEQPHNNCRSAMRSGAGMGGDLPSQKPGVRLCCPVPGMFE